MHIGDGKNDGIFQIKKGQGLSQAITSEMGLDSQQIKSLGQSVWQKIFEQFDEANSDGQICKKNDNGNYSLEEGQQIKIESKIWNKIVNIVNSALKTDIKVDDSDNATPKNKRYIPKKYTKAALEKRFPKPQFEITVTGNFTEIYDCSKKDLLHPEGEIVFVVYKDETQFTVKNYTNDGNNTWELYNLDGKLDSYVDKGGSLHVVKMEKEQKEVKNIVDNINNAVSKKTAGVIPTSGDLNNPVAKINGDNVYKVIKQYEKDYKESILSAIISERGLSTTERMRYIKHIKDSLIQFFQNHDVYCDDISAEFDKELRIQMRRIGAADSKMLDKLVDQLYRRAQTSNVKQSESANGKLDNDFSQGDTRDCWLVSTIKACQNNPKSKKALESLILVDKNGNVTVTLKGPNKKYTFTKEELEGAIEYSSGDMDVRAIEKAVDTYVHENDYIYCLNKMNDVDDGGLGGMATDILFGKGRRYGGSWDLLFDKLFNTGDSLIDKIKTGNYLCVAGRGIGSKHDAKAINNNGDEVQVYDDHAYAVVDADEKYVYFVNPWDTSTTLKLTHEEFKKTFTTADLLDVSKL